MSDTEKKGISILIHHQNDQGDIITLQEDLTLLWRERTLTVPSGFESDGVSTPRFLWSSISPAVDPATLRGGIAHDYLYRMTPEPWTRKEADELFYDLCREDGLSWWKAQKAYWDCGFSENLPGGTGRDNEFGIGHRTRFSLCRSRFDGGGGSGADLRQTGKDFRRAGKNGDQRGV